MILLQRNQKKPLLCGINELYQNTMYTFKEHISINLFRLCLFELTIVNCIFDFALKLIKLHMIILIL